MSGTSSEVNILNIVLTKSSMPIINWIADILGYIISGIFLLLEKIGIPNIGLAIILFTILMYAVMTPLQIKQQKFSRMNSIMMPEIRKIQDKYKNKKDQVSMQKMQAETQAVYEKYGVSPTGSCVQMVIILPVMFALYQVIYHIPGYIGSVRGIFTDLVGNITSTSDYTSIIQKFLENNTISNFSLTLNDGVATKNSIIDFLYKLTTSQWTELSKVSDFSGFTDVITKTHSQLKSVSMFCGMNISDTPWVLIKESLHNHHWLMLIGAVLVPVLAWFTQWLNYRLMPQSSTTGGAEAGSSMEASMKSMNLMMPLMSAFFCITFPIGVGIYWIAGALVRCVQQLVINRHLDRIDIEALVKENQEKAKAKREKKGDRPSQITQTATQNAKRIDKKFDGVDAEKREEALAKAEAYYNSDKVKANSIAAKANMVKRYDEKNKKK